MALETSTPEQAEKAVSAALREVGEILYERVPEFVVSGTDLMREEIPEFYIADSDERFVDLYNESYAASLRLACTGLIQPIDLADREAPAILAAEAERSVQLGVSLDALIRTYRAAQRLLLEATIEQASVSIASPEVRATAVKAASDWYFRYYDWMLRRGASAYQAERDVLVQGRSRLRRRLISRLLAGERADLAQLGYTITATHLGVVASGEVADELLRPLAKQSGVQLITTAGTDATVWAWFGGAPAAVAAAGEAAGGYAGGALALGELGAGQEGFRLTHQQAMDTHRVSTLLGLDGVTRYDTVALEVLASRRLDLVGDFVVAELGPLAQPDERARQLRETLRVYFDAGQNAVAAAAQLKIVDRTVAYRIQSAEKERGRPITDRTLELCVALRLADLLPGTP